MNAAALLATCRSHDVQLSLDGDRLVVDGPTKALTDELCAALKLAKPDLVSALGTLDQVAQTVVGVTPTELWEIMDDEDRAELIAGRLDLATLTAFARAVRDRRLREQGERPPGWDSPAYCAGCGRVWLWEPVEVQGCPWCFNRVQGRSIPRPDAVAEHTLNHGRE